MITGFEDITKDLTSDELKMIQPMIQGLWNKRGKHNAVKSGQIIKGMSNAGHKITGARVRKLINYLRISKKIENLVGTSQGYFIATSQEEIDNYKKSLDERIASIQAVRDSFN